jgi:hypothetical protein
MDLLMNRVPGKSIVDAAQEIFGNFGIDKFEERFSCHYVDDHYYIGSSGHLTVKVMLNDDEDHADLPIWVHIESNDAGPWLELQFVEPLVKDKLLTAGYSVARIEKFGLKGEKRIEY